MNIFNQIVRFLDNTEVSFVTLLAKIIPLLVPIIPAYVGYTHVTDTVTGLGFDSWAGWVYGAVIEGLGYAAIYKAVQFWEHNRKYTAEKNQAPLVMAVIIYLVYLAVTLTVNVVLDYKAGVVIYKVVALGLISLLSVPAGMLMSISAIHTERKSEREQSRIEQRQRRDERTPNEEQGEQSTNERVKRTSNRPNQNQRRTNDIPMPTNKQNERPFGFQTNDKQMLLRNHIEQLQANGEPVPGPSELSRQLQMSKSYISELLKQWQA